MVLRVIAIILACLLILAAAFAGGFVTAYLVRGKEVLSERERAERYLADLAQTQDRVDNLEGHLRAAQVENKRLEAIAGQLRETVAGLRRYKQETESGIDASLGGVGRIDEGLKYLEARFQ